MKRLQLHFGGNYEENAVLLFVTLASIITTVTDTNDFGFF